MENMKIRHQMIICVIFLAFGFFLYSIFPDMEKVEKERNPGMQAGLFITLDQSQQSFYITRMVKDDVCIIQNRAIPEEYFENCIKVETMQHWMDNLKGKITKTNIYRKVQ